MVGEPDEQIDDVTLTAGDGRLHRRRQSALPGRPPVPDLAPLTVRGSRGRPIGPARISPLLDRVRRQLPVGVTNAGGSEGLLTGEVAKLELGAVVAVAHDVRVLAHTSASHADVQRRGGGARSHDDVATINGASRSSGSLFGEVLHATLRVADAEAEVPGVVALGPSFGSQSRKVALGTLSVSEVAVMRQWRRRDWFWAAVTVGTLLNGLRLRRRMSGLRPLAADRPPPLPDEVGGLVTLAVPGVDVDDPTRAAAGHRMHADGLDALALVPADLPVRDALVLARSADLRRHRSDPLAPGADARHAIIARAALLERSGVEPPADRTGLAAASHRLKLHAPRSYDVAVAPSLNARSVSPAERRALLDADPSAALTVGLAAARAGTIALGLVSSPAWGLAALGAWCAEPYLALSGTALTPRDLSLGKVARRWLTEPLHWLRTARAAPSAAGAPPAADPVEARRYEYATLLADGTDGFFEPRQSSCPLCDHNELVEVLRTGDVYQRKPGEFVLERCVGCGHVFQNPRLSLKGLEFYYRDFYDGLGEAGTEFAFSQAGASYRGRAELVARHAAPATWLDVGAGHGHFCLMAKERFPNTSFDGLDMSESIEEAERRGWIERGLRGIFPAMVDQLDSRYDVVSMHHYLEHTLDPLAELDAARAVLRPGGHLLIEVPDPECWFARALGPAWTQWVQPQHLHFLSVANLSGALAARGFEVVEVERGEVHLPVDLAGSVMLSALRFAPPPTVPWLDPPRPVQRAGRAAVLGAAVPAALGALVLDRAVMAPLATKVDGISNAYRVLARLAG